MANISELNQYGKNITGFKVSRSRFPLDNENVLTLKAGDIVPLWKMDIMPGDTIQTGFTFVMRMLTPVSPIMDNCFMDVYAFFVPNRLLCDKYHLTTTEEGYVDKPTESGNWKTFFTENENGAWSDQETTYLKLYKPGDQSVIAPQSVLDYLGYPIGKKANTNITFQGTALEKIDLPTILNNPVTINGLYIAALDLIYNDWFRNENLEAPTLFRQNGEIGTTGTTKYSMTDIGQYAKINASFCFTDGWKYSSSNTYNYTYPYKATKYADLFTNCLPEPLKLNTEIVLGLAGTAPINIEGTTTITIPETEGAVNTQYNVKVLTEPDLVYNTPSGSETKLLYDKNGGGYLHTHTNEQTIEQTLNATGLADLSEATAITINQLREAITIQHIAEAFARGGTRYSEILHAIYGTAPDDITLERPELLGAKRFPINTTQVVNSAITSSGDLGELGAYSHTIGSDEYIISKSFKEHGVVMIVGVIRTSNKYYQGVPKEMSKNKLFDYYFPQFAGLGEQAVLNKEIYASGNEETDNEVFGYQEAFYEYHYKKDELHGLVNPCAADLTLASYTYQIPFDTTPTLCKDFDTQDAASVGNVLYDTTTISQFLLDIYFKTTATREMPVHAIPGVDRI